MAKDDSHRTRALVNGRGDEFELSKDPVLFRYCGRIQEEVHRFTVSKMSSAKSKTLTKSSLTKISGIGDAKAKILLKSFGGYTGVKNATLDQLKATKGISERDAESIVAYFKKGK